MTILAPGVVDADDLSVGWIETLDTVRTGTDQKMFHTMTKIRRPLVEDPEIRSRVDALLRSEGRSAAETVANTIFPLALADSCIDHHELIRRYRAVYQRIKRYPDNHFGTYFGRIVAHPNRVDPFDQLSPLIAKVSTEHGLRGPKSARYEVSVADPDDVAATLSLRSPALDTSPMGFPCLSFCSFQLDRGSLHLLAHYRYEYLFSKGYGNYLGLARLLRYVAEQAGVTPGTMSVVTGRAHVDISNTKVRRNLDDRQLALG